MVVLLEIETWVIGKGGAKMGSGVGWGKGMGVAGFFSPCVCLGIFLIL
jgi:hypothetical protein